MSAIIPSREHARQAMLTALSTDRDIDVVFARKETAISFRFRCYQVKSFDKKTAAKMSNKTTAEISHEFDGLVFRIVPLGEKWALRISHARASQLAIYDADTGERIEIASTLSLADIGLDPDSKEGEPERAATTDEELFGEGGDVV